MFGTNTIRKKEPLTASPSYQVHDIWYTIQGEGPFMGTPAVFVRFSGCTLACFWCDTSWNDAAPYESLEVVAKNILVRTPAKCGLIVFTGGEPLRQDLAPLFYRLLQLFEEERGYKPHLQIETAGVIYDDALTAWTSKDLTVVVSPKSVLLHKDIWARANAFKYVLDANALSEEDGLPIASTQREGAKALIARPRPGVPVFVSPMDVQDEEQNKTNMLRTAQVAMQYGYRVSLQMHKILELP